MAVTESLTKRRLRILKESVNLLGSDNVWTFNGEIHCKIDDAKKIISSQEELYDIISEPYVNPAH